MVAHLFDDAELLEVEAILASNSLNIRRGGSTPQTRARYAFLRSKRQGAVWQEGRFLYRRTAGGVTVFDVEKLNIGFTAT